MSFISSHIKKFKELHNQINELTKDNEQKTKAIDIMSKELERLYTEHNTLERFTQEYCGINCAHDNCDNCINQQIMNIIKVDNKYKRNTNRRYN